jgi:hypothetical protein
MSKPINPLSNLFDYEPKHVLIAFKDTVTASNFLTPPTGVGKTGTKVDGGIVLVNELVDRSYSISRLTWSFDFFAAINSNTTISAGNFIVADSRGNQFPSFLRRVAKKLKLQETRITFWLQTSLHGKLLDNFTSELIVTKPLIFNITDSATGFQEGLVNQFMFNFAMSYNTVGQLPNYSRLNQFTVTNSEGNPSKGIPTTDEMLPEILTRAKEDALNFQNRQNRINKSAPMRTLKSIFESFEADLKDMRFENKRQLQEFLAVIRTDHIKKIKTPKSKVSTGKPLPIDFKVQLDKSYYDYPVDNRNLITEQTENRQVTAGICSITMPPISDVFSAVDSLMKLSGKVADDIENGKAFKVVMTSTTDAEGIVLNTIIIKPFIIPVNKQNVKDTGPDTDGTVLGADKKPQTLELQYMEGRDGMDIMGLTFSSIPSADMVILEDDSDDLKDDALSMSSQREQITFERRVESGFSGLRVAASPMNYGLQSGKRGVLHDTLRYRYVTHQNTLTIIDIVGNPDLYSDLARNPLKVASIASDSPKLYQFPEYYPMYVSVKVRIGNTNSFGSKKIEDEEYWYHTYHYHLTGVTNQISGGEFNQVLRLLSTDDAI